MPMDAGYEGLLAALLAVANKQLPTGRPSIADLVAKGYATNPPPSLTRDGARELVELLQAKFDLDEEPEADPNAEQSEDLGSKPSSP